MELVMGMPADELGLGIYVDCPEEDRAYTLRGGVLRRHDRGARLEIDHGRMHIAEEGDGEEVDPEVDVAEHERPRLRRIARMLSEAEATARLASPYVVLVPREGDPSTKGIRRGSGVVGAPQPGAERVAVYYEGAIYDQPELARLADRVFHAHGRLVENYPTVARMAVARASLVEAGTFDPASGTIMPIDAAAEAVLAAWLGSERLDPAELVRSGGAPR
ncbi:MAG: hypothetical protein JST59_29585 [Actinobacteria bacterium]|nr:hypothetical protein [Actinomycetota bacterium]